MTQPTEREPQPGGGYGSPYPGPAEPGGGYGSPYPGPGETGGRGPVPGGVRTASVLLYVGGVLGIVVGLLALAALHGVGLLVGVVLLAFGALEIYLGRQIARGNRGARNVTVVLCLASIVFDVVAVLRGRPISIVSLLLSALIVYLLRFQPTARRFFGDVT